MALADSIVPFVMYPSYVAWLALQAFRETSLTPSDFVKWAILRLHRRCPPPALLTFPINVAYQSFTVAVRVYNFLLGRRHSDIGTFAVYQLCLTVHCACAVFNGTAMGAAHLNIAFE